MKNIKTYIWLLGFLLLAIVPTAIAEGITDGGLDGIDTDTELTQEDKDLVNDIVAPFLRLFNIFRVLVTIACFGYLIVAGAKYLQGSLDFSQQEKAKKITSGIAICLLVLWVGPLVVMLMLG